MIRTVFYFVDDISTPFVLKDIQKMSEEFEQVFLFSCELLPEKHLLPANVRVFEDFVDWNRFNGLKVMFFNFITIFKVYWKESIALKKCLPLKRSLALLTSNLFKASEIIRHIQTSGINQKTPSLYYSFWFYDCIYLAFLKKYFSFSNIISRAHGGDLYEDSSSLFDKLLFRNFQMQSLDAVFPVSQIGADYLISRYPMAKTKVKSIFLGTEDPIFTNPFDPDNFILVSCASIRYKKRIHAIAEALSHMTIPLTWYHFGDENLESNDPSIPEYLRMRETLKLNSNIHYRPMGQTDNKLLFNFYRNNSISLFISLSETEGIPVSIMEAISFGIPVLSTDVGGCREIVNNTTGILIPLDTDAKAVATKLTEFKDSEANTLSFRQGVRKFWENHFDAQKNYSYFFQEIKSISNDQ